MGKIKQDKKGHRVWRHHYRASFVFGDGDFYLLNDEQTKENEIGTENDNNIFEWNESGDMKIYICVSKVLYIDN